MDIILVLILMFTFAALTGFVLSVAVLSIESRLRANLLILVMIFGVFLISWIRLAI